MYNDIVLSDIVNIIHAFHFSEIDERAADKPGMKTASGEKRKLDHLLEEVLGLAGRL
jgi:hypothetical protein